MKRLTNEVTSIKEAQRRGCVPDALDHNDVEVKEVEAQEAVEEEPEDRFIKLLIEMRGKKKMDVPNYSGSLDPENLIECIRETEKYFDIENLENPKRVKTTCLKLKSHASLWWDSV